MYADSITRSMALAIDETTRRRARQVAYNLEHGIDPTPLRKRISDVTDMLAREDLDTAELLKGGYRQPTRRGGAGRGAGAERGTPSTRVVDVPMTELAGLIQELTDQMHGAAAELQFELAARLRDEIAGLKKELRQMQAATG
jgi:excinuclease ABC subunit B